MGLCSAQNYEVRLMSIIGLCISDLLQVDLDGSLNLLQSIIEPYIIKLDELSNLKEVVDKHQQAMTCHMLNMLTQLMSSLIQRQRSHEDESIGSQNQSMNQNESLNKSKYEVKVASNNEKKIVNSLLVKLVPIYKTIIKRNLASDLILIDVS
jgi:type IV secretory pathway TrbF-like protein